MDKPVVIIGAGPAGLACAGRLLRGGRHVVLIDDNLQAGGQYFRQLPRGTHATSNARLPKDRNRAGRYFEMLRDPLLTYLPSTTAWASMAPLRIAYSGSRSGRIDAAALVLATGAQDAPFPFTGWTLPGVVSAGGALNMVKGHGIVPEGRVVVAGNGPLVLVAAATLARAGAEVIEVIEAQSTARLANAVMGGIFRAPGIVAKGIKYRASIFNAGARFRSREMIVRAEGGDWLRSVTLAPVGADGRPDTRRERTLSADLLVSGYGLLPSTEFARGLGCAVVRDAALGGWVPRRNDNFETSQPGVYAVGDGAGIGGVEVALLEGEIAAAAILASAGGEIADTKRAYLRLNRFRRSLSNAYRPRVALSAVQEETIICRCEELRLTDLRDAAGSTPGSLPQIKAATRLGMGRCQGRNCLTSAATIFGIGQEGATNPYPRIRQPVRPVRICELVADTSIGLAREPDEAISTQSEETP